MLEGRFVVGRLRVVARVATVFFSITDEARGPVPNMDDWPTSLDLLVSEVQQR